MEFASEERWADKFGNSHSKKLVPLGNLKQNGWEKPQTERSGRKDNQEKQIRDNERSRTPPKRDPNLTAYQTQSSANKANIDHLKYSTFNPITSTYSANRSVQAPLSPRSSRSTYSQVERAVTPKRGRVLLEETDRDESRRPSKTPERKNEGEKTNQNKSTEKVQEKKKHEKEDFRIPPEHSRYDDADDSHRSAAIYSNYTRDLGNLIRERELLRERSKEQKKLYADHEHGINSRVGSNNQHQAYLNHQKQLRDHKIGLHNEYREINTSLTQSKKAEQKAEAAEDANIMKRLVEYERLKIEAAEAVKQQEASRVQTYRSQLKQQLDQDRARNKEIADKERAVSPGMLGSPQPDLYENRQHRDHFKKMYQQYLEDINHQVAHKKLQKQEEQKREEEEIRKIVDADRKSVEVARSKTRELKKINRDIQDQIWQDCQSKRKAENEQRNHENSKERNQTSRNVVDNDKMLKDHSQRRRILEEQMRLALKIQIEIENEKKSIKKHMIY